MQSKTSTYWLVAVILAIAIVVGYLAIGSAKADNTNTNSSGSVSGSQSSNSTNVVSGTSSYGSVSNTVNNPSDLSITGTPGLGSLALGGGHPCAFAPATGQVSILGFGGGVGGMKVDDACMLMVMGYNDPRAHAAALYMIASRSIDACHAMQMQGLVSGCDGAPAQPLPDDGLTARLSRVAGIQCVVNGAGKLVKIFAPAGTDNGAAQAACR